MASKVESIVDVEWSLDLVAARSHALAGDLAYYVTVKTSNGNVYFTCNTQELQDLVTKLKEIIRHAEKFKTQAT